MKFWKAIAKPITALAGKIDDSIERKILMSVARKGLAAFGGVLIAKGYLQSESLSDFVGAGLVIVSALAGAHQKTATE